MKTKFFYKQIILLCLFAFMANTNYLFAAKHVLFSNGTSKYVITIASNALISENTAAKELQQDLKTIGGALLPISNDLNSKGYHIYIGYNAKVAQLVNAKKPAANDETYVYRSIDSDIVIYGGAERGTMYGVYAFLERELGCRWYTPDLTKMESMKSWSFSLLNHSESPAIQMRLILYKNAFDPAWAAHNLTNGQWGYNPMSAPYGGGCSYWNAHTSGQFMPASKYFAEHPEYFSMRDGKRVPDGQLCLTNPDVLKICTEKLLQAIKNEPNSMIYDMSQNDNTSPCQCKNCQALAKKYGAESGVWIWFVNQVADQVKKVYPDKYVGTFAYQYTRKPPVGITPRDNVVIRLCSIECCFMHSIEACSSDLNKAFMEDLNKWMEIAPHLYIWDYVVSFTQYLAPFPNFAVLAPNIETFQKHHAIGILEEAQYQSSGGELSELRAYVLAKALWNPHCDVDAVVKEFINAYYGNAADSMQQYYDLLQGQVKPETHMGIFPDVFYPIFTDDFINKASALFEKAKKECQDEATLHRVERASLGVLYLKTMRNKERSMNDGTYKELVRICSRDSIQVNKQQNIKQFRAQMEAK